MNRREKLENIFNSTPSSSGGSRQETLQEIFNGRQEPEEEKSSFLSRAKNFLGIGEEKQSSEQLSAFSADEKLDRSISSVTNFGLAPTGLMPSLFSNTEVQKRGRQALQGIADSLFTSVPDATVALTQQSVANMSEYEYAEATRELLINKGIPESEIDEELIRIQGLEKNKAIYYHLSNLIDAEGNLPEKTGLEQALQIGEDTLRSSIQNPINFFSNQNFDKVMAGVEKESEKDVFFGGFKALKKMLSGEYLNDERIDIFESTTKKELKKLQEKWNISEDDLIKQQKEAYKKSLGFVQDVQEGSRAYREASFDRLDLANDKTGKYIYNAAGGVTSLAMSLAIFSATKNPNTAAITASSYFAVTDNENFDDSVARALEANPDMSKEQAEKAVAQSSGSRRFANFAVENVGFGLLFNRFQGGKLLNFAKGTIEQLSEEVIQNSASNYLENKYYNKNKNTLDGTIDTILYSFPTALFGGASTSFGGLNYQDRQEIEYQKEQAAQLFVKNHGITKEDALKIVDKIGGVMDDSVSQFQDYIKVNPERRYGPAQEFQASDVALAETGERTTEQLIADSENKEAQSLLPMVIEPTGIPGGTVQQATTDYELQRRMEFAMQNSQYSQLLDKAENSSSFEDFLDSQAVVFDDGDMNISFDNLKNPNVITINEQGNQRGQITLSEERLAISGFTGRRIENISNESGMSNVDVYRKILPLLGEDGLIINKIDPVPNGFNYVNLAGGQMLLMNTQETNVNPVDFLRSAWKKKYFKEQKNRVTLGANPVYQKDMGLDSTLESAQSEQKTEQMQQFQKFVEQSAKSMGLKVTMKDSSGGWVDFENGNKQVEPSKVIELTGRVPIKDIVELAENIRAEYNQDSVMILHDSFQDKDTLHKITFNDPTRGYELSMELMDKFGIGGYTFENESGTLSTLEFGMKEEIDTFINENINDIKNYEERENTGYYFQSRTEQGDGISNERPEPTMERTEGQDDTRRNERVESEAEGNIRANEEPTTVQRVNRDGDTNNHDVDGEKVSRLLERAVEEGIVGSDVKLATYEIAKREENIQKAVEFVMKDPQLAIDISLGFVKDTSGIQGEYLGLAAGEYARVNGMMDVANQIITRQSLKLTEYGQSIQSVSRLGDTSIFSYIQQFRNFKQANFRLKKGLIENTLSVFNKKDDIRDTIKREKKNARSEIISNSVVEGDPFLESLLC